MTFRHFGKSAVLGAMCVALGLLYAWRVTIPADDIALPGVTAPAPPTPSARPATIVLPDRAQFSEISARPVFRADRRPPSVAPTPPTQVAAPPAPPPPPPAAEPGVTLLGVMLGPTESIALVRVQGVATSQALTVGDKLQGWHVEAIEADHVLLRSGSDRRQLPLGPPLSRRPGEGVTVHPSAATARVSP